MRWEERAKQLKRDIPAVFLALKHPKTPIIAKITASIVVIYALSPIDLIPDFIPVLGYLDDLVILPILIALTIKMIPIGVIQECREASIDMWQNGKPKKWYFALPFVFFWFILMAMLIKTICLK